MEHQNNGVEVAPNGNTVIDGDVAGRDIIKQTEIILPEANKRYENAGTVIVAVIALVVVLILALIVLTRPAATTPEARSISAGSTTSLATNCQVGVLCDVIPQYAVDGKMFIWSYPDKAVTSELIQPCARSGLLGLGIKYALAGEYDNGGWGVHWVERPDKRLDVSRMGYLSFWVKGSIGNEIFQIGLKDTLGTEYVIQSTEFASKLTEWTQIAIPLSRFTGIQTNSIENVSFSITSQHRAGNICLDDIEFK